MSQWDFGPFSAIALTGFPSGTVLADRGLRGDHLVRHQHREGRPLRARVRPGRSSRTASAGYNNTYYSGVGITTSFNGPWDATRIRAEVGYPVVAHGVHGFTINVQLLKVF